MPRTKYETISLSYSGSAPETIQPGSYHPEGFDCGAATETDEGCRWCQEEIEEVEENIVAMFRDKGREVLGTYFCNIPERDGYWEVEVESKKLW